MSLGNFKEHYSSEKKHVESLQPQCIPSEFHLWEVDPATVSSHNDADIRTPVPPTSSTQLSIREALTSSAVATVQTTTGMATLPDIMPTLLQLPYSTGLVWRLLKKFKFSPTVPRYADLLHKSKYGANEVYGSAGHHDVELCIYGDSRRSLPIEDMLAPFYFDSAIVLSPGARQVFGGGFSRRWQPLSGETVWSLPLELSSTPMGFMECIFVESNALVQPVMLGIYPFWLKHTNGVSARFKDVSDEPETQSVVLFFSVNGF